MEWKTGKKYRKEEIEAHHSEFDLVDFTGKRDGRPVMKVVTKGQTLVFVKDRGGKFVLSA